MTEVQDRPGSAYVASLEARLPWAARQVTVHGHGDIEPQHVTGAHLIADVAEALAEMGVLAGEEHHHQVSEDEARECAEFLLRQMRNGTAAARRYGPEGLGVTGVLRSTADLEFVVPAALAGCGSDGATRQAVHSARKLIQRYLDERSA